MAEGAHNLTTIELLALLRDGSLKPESIAEEMECAGAHPCTAAQISEARDLLALLQQERTAQSVGLLSEGAAAEPENPVGSLRASYGLFFQQKFRWPSGS